jgi:hypothetical protein
MLRFIRQQNIRIVILWGALVSVDGGCAADPEKQKSQTTEPPPDLVQCMEPRPQICTMIYLPVCATLRDGTTRTYASDCVACSDPNVVGYRPNQCE